MADYAGVKRVGVVGAGTIGASWAAFFLARGLEVSATDPAPDAEARLRRFVDNAWPALERLGLAPGARREALRFSADAAAAVEGVDFIQESGPEREEAKIALFAQLDAATPRETIIASSSSALLISRLQVQCRFPERCVLGHPFNPPHLIPLVEVVGGEKTSEDAIARAMAFYAAVGKAPIRLKKEIAGHVANRLQGALWQEAVNLLAEGVADVKDIDTAVSQGPGIRWAMMGPYLTFHLAGGEGGLGYWMDNISRLGSWMTPEVRQQMVDGVAAATGGRPIRELAAERDERLLALLEALQRTKA